MSLNQNYKDGYGPEWPYEVKITEPSDTERRLTGIYDAFAWLEERGYNHNTDFKVDMFGGERNYCSLYFKDNDIAIIVKLSISGAV